MAVRAPLYWDSVNEEIREMTSAQVTQNVIRMVYNYSLNPTVDLTYVASAGTLNSMDDTRMQAGAASTSTTAFVSEALTADISQVATSYDHISEAISGPASYPGTTDTERYPLYWDTTTGDIRGMTQQDMIDTFITPAVDYLAAGNSEATGSNKGGTFYISTTNTPSDGTLVNASPVFINTEADAAAYTSAGIPESQDQPTTINNYYLVQYAGHNATTGPVPLKIESATATDLKTYPDADWDSLLGDFLKYATASEVGERINFQIYEAGSQPAGAQLCGSAIVDSRLNGLSADGYTTRLVNANDYRSQEFPNGVSTTIKTYGLYVTRS